MEMARELWVFLRARKKFWMWPIIGMMFFLGAFVALFDGCVNLAGGRQASPRIRRKRISALGATQPGHRPAP